MTHPWKPGAWAMVEIIGPSSAVSTCWDVRAGTGYQAVAASALHPLPSALSAEDAAVIKQATYLVEAADRYGTESLSFAAHVRLLRHYVDRRARAAAPAQETEMVESETPREADAHACMMQALHDEAVAATRNQWKCHTGMDYNAAILRVNAAGMALDAALKPAAGAEAKTMDQAQESKIVGAKDAIVAAALNWRKHHDRAPAASFVSVSQPLVRAIDTLAALLSPPSPAATVDLVEELREAAEALHNEIAEYQRINSLGGWDNHNMRRMRAALAAIGER